jgi:hypothetical protein
LQTTSANMESSFMKATMRGCIYWKPRWHASTEDELHHSRIRDYP